jgi:hypothetical protein
MAVRFDTRHTDFPANVSEVTISGVALLVQFKDGVAAQEMRITLEYTPPSAPAPISAQAMLRDGLIATRLGNAGGWTSFIGKPGAGLWKMRLPEDEPTRSLFRGEQIEDIIFVLTYSGQLPSWPSS